MNAIDKYKIQRPLYDSLARRLQSLLHDVVKTNGIEVHAIEARAKTVESFSEKTSRPGKIYEDPLKDITDLCGIRVILYYQDDVDRLSKILREEFKVDKERSVDKRDELRSDQFGYMSVHLICQLQENRTGLLEWRDYIGFYAEIQVRTVLQHAWASISHALQYKSKSDIPDQFVRQLTRIAGLLELSDEQFSNLREKTADLRLAVGKSLAISDLNVVINSVSMTQFIASSNVVVEIVKSANGVGFTTREFMSSDQLTATCQRFRIFELSKLSETLDKFLLLAPMFFKSFAKLQAKRGVRVKDVTGSRDHWASLAVVVINCNSSDANLMAEDGLWGHEYFATVIKAAKEVKM